MVDRLLTLVLQLLFIIVPLAYSLIILVMKTWKYLLIFLGWADKLILNATKINEYEEEHNERMRKIFSEKLGTILVEYKKNRQKCKSNGVLTTSLGTLIAYLEILEGKNEIETDKNDPIIQEALYYRDYWSQDNVCII